MSTLPMDRMDGPIDSFELFLFIELFFHVVYNKWGLMTPLNLFIYWFFFPMLFITSEHRAYG
jgi:hypothetical protein